MLWQVSLPGGQYTFFGTQHPHACFSWVHIFGIPSHSWYRPNNFHYPKNWIQDNGPGEHKNLKVRLSCKPFQWPLLSRTSCWRNGGLDGSAMELSVVMGWAWPAWCNFLMWFAEVSMKTKSKNTFHTLAQHGCMYLRCNTVEHRPVCVFRQQPTGYNRNGRLRLLVIAHLASIQFSPKLIGFSTLNEISFRIVRAEVGFATAKIQHQFLILLPNQFLLESLNYRKSRTYQ